MPVSHYLHRKKLLKLSFPCGNIVTQLSQVETPKGHKGSLNGCYYDTYCMPPLGTLCSMDSELSSPKGMYYGNRGSSHGQGTANTNGTQTTMPSGMGQQRGISHTSRHAYLFQPMPTSHLHGWLPISHRYAIGYNMNEGQAPHRACPSDIHIYK